MSYTLTATTGGASMTKRCARCHQHKPFAAFNVARAAADGRQRRCRRCEVLTRGRAAFRKRLLQTAFYARDPRELEERLDRWEADNAARLDALAVAGRGPYRQRLAK